MDTERQIVPGISISSFGQMKIDPATRDAIINLAIDLEKETKLPVTSEHVVAAIRLAARKYKVLPNQPISNDDPALVGILIPHLKNVFSLVQRHRKRNVTNDD